VALGWVQLKRDDAQASFTSANEALRLNRRSVDALAIRGAALSALGSHRSAVEVFAEVERTDPSFLAHNRQFAPYVSASRAAHAVGLLEFNP
jgi:lipopolysaccharide biosynthesis regulator YciM